MTSYIAGKVITYDVSYREDYVSERVTDVEIKNIIRKNFYFRTIDEYVRIYIEMVKENVIRYLDNLNAVSFNTFIIDKNNIKHRILISLYDITCDLLNIPKLDIVKIIFVEISYYNHCVYRGDIDFANFI